jgi:Peptidase family M28
MAKHRKTIRNKKEGRGKSIWIMIGLLILGLVIGVAVGYCVHYYLVNPAPKKTVAKKATTKKQSQKAKKYNQPLPSESTRVQQIMTYLNQVGPRVAGSQAENVAATYLKNELEKTGYSVGWQQFALPTGDVSQYLATADPGQSNKYTFLVCANIDTRAGSPGANSNASGCAAVLELARCVKGTKHLTEIRFLLFGASEGTSRSRSQQRLGSTYYLSTQSPAEQAKIVGVVSADTISVGPEVHVRDWGSNSPGLAQDLIKTAQTKGMNAYQDPSPDSDHEPFGNAGIPAVWVERMLPGGKVDPAVNTSSDTIEHTSADLVTELVDLLQGYIVGLDETYCKAAVNR